MCWCCLPTIIKINPFLLKLQLAKVGAVFLWDIVYFIPAVHTQHKTFMVKIRILTVLGGCILTFLPDKRGIWHGGADLRRSAPPYFTFIGATSNKDFSFFILSTSNKYYVFTGRNIIFIKSWQTATRELQLDAGMWRYHANRMDARRSQFDLGRVDAYI